MTTNQTTNETPATETTTTTPTPAKAPRTKRSRKPTPKGNGQFDSETSAELRLATASATKMATIIARVCGVTFTDEEAKDRGFLKRTALEHGWGWHVGNVVNKQKKQDYGAAQHCDDDMANALAAFVRSINPETKADFLDMDKVRDVAKLNHVSLDRWLHLNVGQTRMNLGNVLRGKVRRGFKVIVGDKVWNKTAEIDEPKKAKKAAKKAKKAEAKKAA